MKRSLILAAIVLTAAVISAAACEKVQLKPTEEAGVVGKETSPLQGEVTQPSLAAAVATIVVTTGEGHQVPFSVEIAQSDEERAKGLMGRESLAANSGMWFVFPQSGDEKFWMKDMTFPLDLVYVDEGMKVVHIIENATAGSTSLLASPVPFKYVLEVNAGTAAKHEIKVGNTVEKRIGPQ